MTLSRAISNLRALHGFKMKSDRELDEVIVAVLEGLRGDYLLMAAAGKAARAAVDEEARKHRTMGAIAVQDSWDASVAVAVIDHLIREASGDGVG